MSWTLNEIIEATEGHKPENWQGPSEFTSICTDTRAVEPGCLFVPLKGEKFDGHDFVQQALQAGAGAALWARPDDPCENSGKVLRVSSGLAAYQKLGSYHRKRLGVPCVAITGSVGKTTVKDLVTTILGSCFKVCSTPLNYNNEVGVPKTLLSLEADHKAVIIEMGMRGRGQIKELARLCDPYVGAITTIGESHMEILGSREAIAEAKAELFDEMGGDSLAVIPADSDFYQLLCEHSRHIACTTFGVARACWQVLECSHVSDESDLSKTGSRMVISYDDKKFTFQTMLHGMHNAVNLACALAVASKFGIKANDPRVVEAIYSFRPANLRGGWEMLGDVLLIDDSYNAAPASVKAALQTVRALKDSGKRRKIVAVLGDMLELGDNTSAMHADIGRDCAKCGIDKLIVVGELSRRTADAASKSGVETIWAPDAEAGFELLKGLLEPGICVLIKASRGIGLDKTAEMTRRFVNEELKK